MRQPSLDVSDGKPHVTRSRQMKSANVQFPRENHLRDITIDFFYSYFKALQVRDLNSSARFPDFKRIVAGGSRTLLIEDK